MHRSDSLAEADRLMTVCNSCRYCEGLCAVFPAMELRRDFADGDLDYLANLCHACGACYDDCQFSPPHEFAVNVPQVLAQVRRESYGHHAWPAALQPLFARNGVAVALIAALSIAVFILGFVAWNDPAAVVSGGNFYVLMPHAAMAWIFGLVFLYAVLALCLSTRSFWRASVAAAAVEGGATRPGWRDIGRALHDAATLRYLDGGGAGCVNDEVRPKDRRRLYHHLTFYGFLACFAATCIATLYHYAFGLEAPYAWYALPKLFGVPGGVALVIGTAGLLRAKAARDPALVDQGGRGMDRAFVLILCLVGLSGLALWLCRDTGAMGVLLAGHLGLVAAFFLTLPYGKFVHGIYRTAALTLHAYERRQAQG